jgi:hypothetical protein
MAPRCDNDRTFGRGVIKNDHAISQRRRSCPLRCSLKANPDLCRPGPRSHGRCGISDLSAPDQPSLGTRAMISAAQCIAFTVPRSQHDRHAGLVRLYPAHQRRHLRFAGTSRRPSMPSCCAWTRSPRFRRSTAAGRCCRCAPANQRGAATTTPAWHHLVVRCPRYRHQQDYRQVLQCHRARVPQVPRRDRGRSVTPTRRPSRHGQLRHPQNTADPRMARQEAALACASDAY